MKIQSQWCNHHEISKHDVTEGHMEKSTFFWPQERFKQVFGVPSTILAHALGGQQPGKA